MSSFLDPVLFPLLTLNPTVSILILSLLISLFVTLVYKYTTNQSLMKQLKDELSEIQKEMKTLQNDPDKALQVQKRAMEVNMKYMMQSFRATFFTLIPLLIIFGWMSAHYAYEPITPGQEFGIVAHFDTDGKEVSLKVPQKVMLLDEAVKNVTASKARWGLKAEAGNHILELSLGNETYYKKILVTTARDYEPVVTHVGKNGLKSIDTEQSSVVALNLFGWKLGFLGAYIIFSIIFSMALRKFMKVY